MSEITFEQVRDELKNATGEIKNLMDSQEAKLSEFGKRIEKIEIKGNRINTIAGANGSGKKASDFIFDDSGFSAFRKGNQSRLVVELEGKSISTNAVGPGYERKALIAGSDAGVTYPDQDGEVYGPVRRALRVMDLMPSVPTGSNQVEYTREVSFTNSADEQGSEGAAKAESEFTFEQATADVATVAHFANISKQALDDRAALQSYVDGRMEHALMQKVEELVLHGSGDIVGLDDPSNHAAFTRTPDVSGDPTFLDYLAAAQTQLQLDDNEPTGVIINPSDWERIRLLKDSDGNYLFGYPASDLTPRVWGMNVVVSPSIETGVFVMGDFQRGTLIRDRQNPSLELSREHSDNFVRNIVTALAEVRLALTVIRPSAILFGDVTPS